MGKSIYRAGFVIDGDYKGKSIYKQDEHSFVIVSNDEDGKIIVNSLFPTKFSILKGISKSTVDRYEDISINQKEADASAIAKGLIFAGPIGGLLGAAATSQLATYDLALYFSDGQKSIIRITNSNSYQDLKAILFSL